MADELEQNFFYRLKLVTLLLIKNGAPEYRDLLPVVQEHEDKSWRSLPAAQKFQRLESIRSLSGPGTELAKVFTEFPHEWTKNQFSSFQESLEMYCGNVKNQLG